MVQGPRYEDQRAEFREQRSEGSRSAVLGAEMAATTVPGGDTFYILLFYS